MTKTTVLTEESENTAVKQARAYGPIQSWVGQKDDPGRLDGRVGESVTAAERDRIAQWVSLVQPVLGRFHVRLEGVTDSFIGKKADAALGKRPFIDPKTESRFVVSTALTALGTYLYGGHGDAFGKSKTVVNELKKKADAVSAYVLSEALYFSTRELRENHGVLVNLGEGEMPKCGELPEQGANPQIAFGRVFARQDVAAFLQSEVNKLLDPKRTGPLRINFTA